MIFTLQLAVAGTIKVVGRVTDRQGNAVNAATIAVRDSAGRYMSGCLGDSSGCFHIEVSSQAETLSVSCVGYQEYVCKIEKGREQMTVNAVLDSAVNDLGEVVVQSKRPLIRRGLDRIILDAEKLNAAATNFLDVLRHVPGIIVQDDAISMLNKGKVVCYMDGIELKMDMKALTAYLASLSSDRLRQIEVMTTPPAKYSAEGNAGIINFVTKRMKDHYAGGEISDRLSVKEHVYDGAACSWQYRRGKLESYVNAGWGLGTMQTDGTNRIAYSTEDWNTSERNLKSNDYALVTAGADYAFTEKASWGVIFAYQNMRPDADKTAETTIRNKEDDGEDGYFQTFTDFNCRYNRYNANIHYVLHQIGRGGTLSVNADYLNYDIKDRVDLSSTHDETLDYLNEPRTAIRIFQMKADLEMPAGKAVLACGAAYSRSKTDNRTDYEHISNGLDLDDHFVYREDIGAAYADVRYKFSDRLEAKIGLRGEYGRLDGNSLKMRSRTVKRQFDVFPTAYLNYSWRDDNSLSFSVSSRISRPDYVDINPFTTYVDAHTVQSGNPSLLPEKSYGLELGYTYKNFSAILSAKWKTRVVSSYVSTDEARKMTTVTTDNLMDMQMYSLDLSYYFDKVSWFDSSIEGDLYRIDSQPVAGFALSKVRHTSVFLYTDNNFYFDRQKTLAANLWAQYQGREEDVAGWSSPRFRMDLGVKCRLLDKRLSIGIEYQNLLSSHVKSAVENQDALNEYDSKPYRVLNLSLSYRFGGGLKMKRKQFGIKMDRL